MVKITYHGHSCFEITDGQYNLVIDPYLSGNPMTKVKPSDIHAHFVIVTHGHADHWGDAEEIAKTNHAIVIANFELTQFAAKKGCMIHPLHIGGKANFPFGWLKLTIAHHGSSMGEADDYGGNPAGVLLSIGGKTIYHAGDTGLFLDMKLIGELNAIDLALLPIGDNFTMGPVDAAKAVEFLHPKQVVPMHYNTFDMIRQDPDEFAKLVRAQGVECKIMASGDQLTI